MFRPEALKKNEPLVWSPGAGTDVWEMFCASMDGDLETIRALLSREPALVRCSYEYRTPVHFAVRENRVEAAAYLLERGAVLTAVSDGRFHSGALDMARDRGYGRMRELLESALARLGVSPMGESVAAAIRRRDRARVLELLDATPELLRAGDERTNQPIHWAVMTRQLDLIDELAARGADLDARRVDGARPIQLTNGDYHYRGWRDAPQDAAASEEAVFERLLARGASLDICTAAARGRADRVAELLRQDPSLANRVSDYVSYYPGSGAPIRNAAGGGHIEIVKMLLARGADPNLPEEGIAPRGGALYAAVAGGHLEIARLLLEHGADPSAAVESSADCLSRALLRGDGEMADLLASYGAARSVEILAYYGDVRTGAAVFAANPALADDPGALANAAEQGQEAFVTLMLRSRPGLAGRLVFRGAKTRELNELLFRHGMNPSAPSWLGITPLHFFAVTGDLESAGLFLDRGADVNARDDEFCSTPLGCAARTGQRPMVEFLLTRGARPNLPDDPAWATPIAWATRRGHGEIVELLRQYGAMQARPGPHVP